MTDNPTWLDRPLTFSLTPLRRYTHLVVAMTMVRLSGLTCFLLGKPNSNLRVCFVGMTFGAGMGVSPIRSYGLFLANKLSLPSSYMPSTN